MYCKILHKMYQAIKTSVFGKYICRKEAKQSIRGQAPDSEGGSDLDKIFRGGGFFWLFVGGG